MNLQQQHRATPYPYTWEVPVAVVVAVGYALTLGVHLGRAIANRPNCGDWLWPDAVLAGDAAAGLSDTAAGLSDAACVTAGAGALIGWIVASELVIVALLVVGGKWLLDRWGPGRLKGMATPDEAAQLLGVARLRRARRIIRPDLYPGKRAQP
jgi:hypothetical protein